MAETWLKCTECKKDIPFGGAHYVCSVSTCKRSKMRLVFCSVVCWDSHLSTVRHREAWAEEARAPTKEAWQRELAAMPEEPKRALTPAQGVRPAIAQQPPRPVPAPAPPPGAVVRRVDNDATQRITPPPMPAPAPTPDPSQPRRPPPTPDSSQAIESGVARPVSPPVQSRPPTAPATPPPPSTPAPRRVVAGEVSSTVAAQLEGVVTLSDAVDRDILIVISKMKKYIKDRSGFNCSDAIAEALSDHVRNLCDDAIRAAARDDRKTVLDRDVPRPRR